MNRDFLREKQVVIDLSAHLLITLLFCLLVYRHTARLDYVLLIILGGIFIDLDHFFDYFMFYKTSFNLSEFLNCLYLKSGKVYVFLHSWEITLILLLIGIFINSLALFLLAVSMAFHLIIDNVQRKNIFFYFLIYRMLKHFDTEIILPEKIIKF